jgi:hypothetical protein
VVDFGTGNVRPITDVRHSDPADFGPVRIFSTAEPFAIEVLRRGFEARVVLAQAAAAARKDRRRGKWVHERMLHLLQHEKPSWDWSARQFAERLRCTMQAVVRTGAWKLCLDRRAKEKAAARHDLHQPGRRRQRPASGE